MKLILGETNKTENQNSSTYNIWVNFIILRTYVLETVSCKCNNVFSVFTFSESPISACVRYINKSEYIIRTTCMSQKCTDGWNEKQTLPSLFTSTQGMWGKCNRDDLLLEPNSK